MTANVLMRPDPKGRSFAFALALHGSLIGSYFLMNWLNAQGPRFGEKDAGGASIGVEAVDRFRCRILAGRILWRRKRRTRRRRSLRSRRIRRRRKWFLRTR